jgi:hypothetical protein
MAMAARVLLLAGAIIAATTPVYGQDAVAPAPRVRAVDSATALLLRDLGSRSATARALVAEIERSDLIVYVRYRWFATGTLRGRIGFVPSDGTRRVAIEIASRNNYVDQLVTLGHELQHAAEIAAAPSAVDARSLAALYLRIGEALGQIAGSHEAFETQAATDAGQRVRREIYHPDTVAPAADGDR